MRIFGILFPLFMVTCEGLHDLRIKDKFNDFVQKYSKQYSTAEQYNERLQIFANNLGKIDHHNALKSKTWTKGVNKFSDLTEDEFKSVYASGRLNIVKREGAHAKRPTKDTVQVKDLPKSKDWRTEGIISPPRSQGQCGSCWAFSSAAQLESYLALKTGKLEILSPQQITSCTPNPLHCGGTGGCDGSVESIAFTYAHMMGIVREEDYPYTSGETSETGECKYDAESQEAAVYVRGYETLPHNNYTALLNHVATVGPLSISADASAWHSYEGGVFDGCPYDENIEINHGIQLVGYGTDPEHGDYWIVKNSWGPDWGEEGYIRLKRETEAVCGTDSTPSMGSACEGDGNAVQKVCGMCGVLFDTSYPIGADVTSGIRPDK